jgi:hypothetical protein
MFRYKPEPQFVRWPGDYSRWLILGNIDQLPMGSVVSVPQYHTGELVQIEITEYIGERKALKRDGTRVRYVLCAFDNLVEEPKTGS